MQVAKEYLSTYRTIKFVTIRSARLGLLHNVLLLVVMGYIVVFKIVADVGWVKLVQPVGTVRMQLQGPTQMIVDNRTGESYPCDPDYPGCAHTFCSRPALASLPAVLRNASTVLCM